jgi:hypothetical protein
MPASKVDKPRRLKSTRHAVPDARLAEINEVAATTGDDPALDALLLRLHIETACRRGGALALRPIDLDPAQCQILLREKGGTRRWQPVSPTLMAHLQHHARERHAPPNGRLLRYRNGRPITQRRYDYLRERIGRRLRLGRHPTDQYPLAPPHLATWVERNSSHAIAREYAGHTDGDNKATTTTYVRAMIHEVAAALAALTGEPHPLAQEDGASRHQGSAKIQLERRSGTSCHRRQTLSPRVRGSSPWRRTRDRGSDKHLRSGPFSRPLWTPVCSWCAPEPLDRFERWRTGLDGTGRTRWTSVLNDHSGHGCRQNEHRLSSAARLKDKREVRKSNVPGLVGGAGTVSRHPAQSDAVSQANPSGSVKGPASLPIMSRCDPVPSGETPASLARARCR